MFWEKLEESCEKISCILDSYKMILRLVCLCLTLSFTVAWDNDDYEIFDLVEEVNKNFYELLGLTQVIYSSIFD